MSPHPDFNANSTCHNCAAFVPTSGDGECHRHAPHSAPYTEKRRMCDDGDPVGEWDIYEEEHPKLSVWPNVFDGFFCLEWWPKFKPAQEG